MFKIMHEYIAFAVCQFSSLVSQDKMIKYQII